MNGSTIVSIFLFFIFLNDEHDSILMHPFRIVGASDKLFCLCKYTLPERCNKHLPDWMILGDEKKEPKITQEKENQQLDG